MADPLSQLPEGAIPIDQFQADSGSRGLAMGKAPEGAIPIDQFQSDEQKYSTPGQTALAGAEALGRGLAGPLVTGAEQFLSRAGVPGISGAEREGREAAHPILSGVGEAAGLIGGALTGTGEAAVLSKIGEATVPLAEAAGIGGKGAGVLAKIGSGAVKGAVENAVYQLGSEASHYLNDPTSVQDVIPNMGLAAVIGGGLGGVGGAVGSLWKTTEGSKLGSLLRKVANKAGGIEGEGADAVRAMVDHTGLDIPAEVQAGLSSDPMVRNAFETLAQSDSTNSGRAFQESLKDFKRTAGESVVKSMGFEPGEIPDELDKYSLGKNIGETLSKEVKARVSPLKEAYEDFADKFSGKDLEPGTTDLLSEKVGRLALDQGWNVSPSSDIMREVNRVQKELPNLKTLQNLTDYIKAVGDNTSGNVMNGPLLRAGMQMKGILRDLEGELIGAHIGESEGPEVLSQYRATQKAYAAESALKDELSSRIGKLGSTSGYHKVIGDLAQTDGEALFRKLSGKNDADLLRLVQENFPETAEAIKKANLEELIAKSQRAGELDTERLLTNLKKLSPQMREFVLPGEQGTKVQGISQIVDALKDQNYNYSNTGRTLDKLMQYVPGSAVGMVSMLLGHNPFMGFLLGGLTKYLAKDAPDAARLAFLKWMGSSKPIEPGAFKSMVDVLHATMKGGDLTSRAAKAVFNAESKVIPDHLIPHGGKLKKLDDQVKKMNQDPKALFDVAGNVGHYLPDHAGQVAYTASQATQYLNSKRPVSTKQNPLDSELPLTEAQKRDYNRTLSIAEQPLVALKHLKEGTLIPSDIETLKNLYPSLYSRMNQKLMDGMMSKVSKGEQIPYGLRQSLSLFMGQPLDSTMTPQAMQSIQAVYAPKEGQATPVNGQKPTKKSTQKLGKLSEGLATPDQARAMRAMKS